MKEAVIQVRGAVKEFRRGNTAVRAVDGVSLDVHRGEFVAIMGKSGSGKSTLLHLMSGLLVPSSGSIRLLGEEIAGLTDDRLTLLRRKQVGFVFQFFNLLPTLTAGENVALPLLLAGVRPVAAMSRAKELLTRVGLGARADHKPDELSGGQMQRVAIARALVNQPPLLFCDEPTGNLDTAAGAEILDLLKSMQVQHGSTIVMVTHDPKAALCGNRLVTLQDGKVLEDRRLGGVVA